MENSHPRHVVWTTKSKMTRVPKVGKNKVFRQRRWFNRIFQNHPAANVIGVIKVALNIIHHAPAFIDRS